MKRTKYGAFITAVYVLGVVLPMAALRHTTEPWIGTVALALCVLAALALFGFCGYQVYRAFSQKRLFISGIDTGPGQVLFYLGIAVYAAMAVMGAVFAKVIVGSLLAS